MTINAAKIIRKTMGWCPNDTFVIKRRKYIW